MLLKIMFAVSLVVVFNRQFMSFNFLYQVRWKYFEHWPVTLPHRTENANDTVSLEIIKEALFSRKLFISRYTSFSFILFLSA